MTYRQKSVIYKTGSKPLKAAALTKLIIIENLNLQRKFHRLFTKLPKTTSSHACSFPLTNIYHIPHGEACGLTLDYFVRLNAHGEGSERVQYLANKLGFADADKLADAIYELKKSLNLRCDLKDLKLTDKQINELVTISRHLRLSNQVQHFDKNSQ